MEYNAVDFEEYSLPTAVDNRRPATPKILKGKVTRLYYQNPPGRSTLEIYANYARALKSAGFAEQFTCQAESCGTGMYWRTFNGTTVSGTSDVMRYMAARKQQPGGDLYVAIMVSASATSLHVIETKAMQTGLVTVNAEAMGEGIDRDGHINLYAIYFNTGKAALKPESTPALEQIAKLLGMRPRLKLHVVGHTDSMGTFALNMGLSADRAASVAAALTGKYGIAASRLTSHGVGPLAPVATNTSEDGRAKNRRVDLVAP